jgi:hypothetical protein
MSCLAKTTVFILLNTSFLFLSFSVVRAQKTEKGSSAEYPWNKEVHDDGYDELGYDLPGTYSSSLSFGDWKFDTKFPEPRLVTKVANPNPGIFGKYLEAEIFDHRNALLVYIDSVHIAATAPGNKPYSFYFSYKDSLIEQWEQVVLSRQHHRICHFFRSFKGVVNNSANESDPFTIALIFNDSAVQPVSYIAMEKDTIVFRAVFNEKEKPLEKQSASYSSYGGFDFYKNETLIGSARRKLNFVNEVKYVYWFKNTLNQQEQESVAAMIFVIAAFMK